MHLKKNLTKFLKNFYEFVSDILLFKYHYSIVEAEYDNYNILGQRRDIYQLIKNQNSLNNLTHCLCEFAKLKNNREINILDIGANIGIYSIEFSRNKDTNILAFEPFEETFELLKKNIESNSIKNISIFNFGLLDKKTELFLGSPKTKSLQSSIFKYFDKYSLGSKTIFTSQKQGSSGKKSKFFVANEISEIIKLPSLDIIKIDVEGAEMQVLRGLGNLLIKFKPIICIETNSGYLNDNNETDTIEYLLTIGYEKVFDTSDDVVDLKSFKNAQVLTKDYKFNQKSKDLIIF